MRSQASASDDAEPEGNASHLAISLYQGFSTCSEWGYMRALVASMAFRLPRRTRFRVFSGEATEPVTHGKAYAGRPS